MAHNNNKPERKVFGVYIPSILTQKTVMHITEIGNNLKQNLEEKLKFLNEGKCIIEGYVRPKSIKIISYSSGIIYGDFIEFIIVFECEVCHPVEGMLIENCTVTSITKAGIHATVETDPNIVPLHIDIARDHHNMSSYFNSVVEGNTITVSVIGIRYELNDPHIEVIAQLKEPDYNKRAMYKGGEQVDESSDDDDYLSK